VVYNLNRLEKEQDFLILVESILSVFKLHQASLANTLALMGSSLSERQEELIINFLGPLGRALLLLDSDENGRNCPGDCLARLSPKLFVKSIDISPTPTSPTSSLRPKSKHSSKRLSKQGLQP
jgi:DNA primase